jgi:hypothetical protein
VNDAPPHQPSYQRRAMHSHSHDGRPSPLRLARARPLALRRRRCPWRNGGLRDRGTEGGRPRGEAPGAATCGVRAVRRVRDRERDARPHPLLLVLGGSWRPPPTPTRSRLSSGSTTVPTPSALSRANVTFTPLHSTLCCAVCS